MGESTTVSEGAVGGQAGSGALPAAGMPQVVVVAGQELTVYEEWPALLEAMVRDIGGARQRVWVETYIFFNDAGGKRFAAALMERARAGVDVRVLYDAWGSGFTPAGFFEEMAAAGVKVHAYHTLWEGLERFKPLTILNRRDHRKLLVVDEGAGGVGYWGGMNIIDNVEAPRGGRHGRVLPVVGWRDVHVRLLGPQQRELAESFERVWQRARGMARRRKDGGRGGILRGVLGGVVGRGKRPRIPRRAVWRQQMKEIMEAGGADEIRFFDSGGWGRLSRVSGVYAWMIHRAQHQVTVAMAYFVPVGMVLRALLRARKRRVGVRVIVPGVSDVPLVKHATAYLYGRLLKRGFRLYERRQRMMHSKVMIVDERYTVVGSANMDPRSLYSNLELVAVIRSKAMARAMQRICRFEVGHSERITLRDVRKVGWWGRLVNWVAWMGRWWL